MSSIVKVLLVESHGSMALVSLIVLSVVNVPAAVMKVLGVVLWAGRSNILASSHEMIPLLVQHWSIRVVHVTLCWFLLSRVRMVIGCRFVLWNSWI